MAILRKKQRGQYTVIDNTIFRDRGLSNKALGMLCRMLSLPDGWEFSVRGLAELSTDGKSAVMSQLDELEEHGYLVRSQVRKDGKIAGVEYIVSETKLSDFPCTENQHTENQHTENSPQSINKESINKESNTNSSSLRSEDIYKGDSENQKKKRFVKPTVEEIQAYIDERGSNVDAERFFDYYESNGWMVGKSHMKDWKATVRNWERNNNGTKGHTNFGAGNQKRKDVAERITRSYDDFPRFPEAGHPRPGTEAETQTQDR